MAANKPKKLIYAEDVFVSLMKKGWGCTDAAKFTNDIQAADAAPVVHGRWLIDDETGIAYCSACDYDAAELGRYCPECGAVMDLEVE